MSPTLLVTRPEAQAAPLVARLAERGVASVVAPTVAIDASSTRDGLRRMLASLDGAAWLVLTSANGAEALAGALADGGAPVPADVRIAAVGPATATALRDAGLEVDHVPDAYRTVEIAAGLGDVRGRRIVLARADAATPDLREALLARGADVEEVVAYRTIEGPSDSRAALETALRGRIDGVAFTSSSTVRGLLRLATDGERPRIREVPAFCIGPVTAATAVQEGFRVAGVAHEHTTDGLATVVIHHFEDRSP